MCISNDFTVELGEGIPDEVPEGKLTLKAPSFALVEKPFKVSGTTEGVSQTVYIMLMKDVWNVDWLARDDKLAEVISDSEGKYEVEIQLEGLGFNKIYAAQKKEWLGIDWLKGDIKSATQNVLTLNYFIIGGLALAILLLLYKKGVFKSLGGKK